MLVDPKYSADHDFAMLCQCHVIEINSHRPIVEVKIVIVSKLANTILVDSAAITFCCI